MLRSEKRPEIGGEEAERRQKDRGRRQRGTVKAEDTLLRVRARCSVLLPVLLPFLADPRCRFVPGTETTVRSRRYRDEKVRD